MKVRIYKKGVPGDRIYVMTHPKSRYAFMHDRKGFVYRSMDLPKGVVAAIIECTPKEQSRIFKVLYKGLKKT